MPGEKTKSKPPSEPKHPRKLNRRMIIILLLIAVPAAILLTPPLYYGSFTLQVARITIDETTTSGQQSVTVSPASTSSDARSVYEYTYSIQTGGIFRTSDISLSPSQGTTGITIKVTITAPSARSTIVQSPTITGPVGERSHTVYLGPNEGVQAPGLYTAYAVVTVTITQPNGSQGLPSSVPTSVSFFIP